MISIIIPTFNKADLLIEMINSIICQTYSDWELLIIDDGSTDNTIEKIHPFLKDIRIKYFKRPNNIPKGAQGCRNYGFSIADGKYVCFFDADDLISETCLEERVSFIEDVGTDYAVFPAATFQNEIMDWKPSKMGIPTKIDVLTSFLSHYAQFTVWTAIYNKESIRKIQWDEKIKVYQDLDFSISCILAKLSFKFSTSTSPNYFYRFEYSDNCISSNQCTPEKFESTMYFFQKILNNLPSYEPSKSLSYTKDLLQFVMFYLTRIVKSGTTEQKENLLSFIRITYGLYPCFISKMMCACCKYLNNKRVIRLLLLVMYYILLRPTHINNMIEILSSKTQLSKR